MDPISSMLMAGSGMLMQGIGSIFSLNASKEYNQAQTAQINLEQQIETKKQQAMEMDYQARTKQQLRTQQRIRAASLATATAQGAQYGSALPGAYGQSSGETGVNLLALSRGLQTGEQVFELNSQISQQKINQADAQQSMQFGAGLSSFGSSVTNLGLSFGKMQGFGTVDNRAPTPNSNPFGYTGSLY